MKLGINGFGRIGKLSVWHHIGRKFFDGIVVNIGRKSGTCFEDVVHYVERDSTYGSIERYLYGCKSKPIIDSIDSYKKIVVIDGIPVRFLMESRNPAEIDWRSHNVKMVVDTTGKFLNPFLPADFPSGSLRGHLRSGAQKVIISAPFEIADDKHDSIPDDIITTVMGVNSNSYDPRCHRIISNASCTTTCLAHMMKPLINTFGASRILSASMATVHSVTGSQQVLDRLPKANKTDLRKNRSIFNNIILTSTGAAKTLSLVIPEIKNIGFMAQSVRVPTVAGSLIILVLSIQENPYAKLIDRNAINDIYRNNSELDPKHYLIYTDKQNVSGDVLALPRAGTIIEGHETHTRTAEISLDLSNIAGAYNGLPNLQKKTVHVPVTQAVIYGWYDNEMGGYVNLLGDRAVTIAEDMCKM